MKIRNTIFSIFSNSLDDMEAACTENTKTNNIACIEDEKLEVKEHETHVIEVQEVAAPDLKLLDSKQNERHPEQDQNTSTGKEKVLLQDKDNSRQDENSLKQEKNVSVEGVDSSKDELVDHGKVPSSEKDASQPDEQEDTLKQDNWGWDSWADDFLYQASNKVSSLLEKVEDQLGIPDPTEMAHLANARNVEAKDGFKHETEEKQDNVANPEQTTGTNT